MSETTEKIRREFTPSTSPCDMTEKGCVHFHSRVLKLCDEHERLEAEREKLLAELKTARCKKCNGTGRKWLGWSAERRYDIDKGHSSRLAKEKS